MNHVDVRAGARWRFPKARIASVAIVLLGGATLSSSQGPAVPLATFVSSGWDGGNFQNVVTIGPDPTDNVFAGGDMSGVHRSVDMGSNWTGVNKGLTVVGKTGGSPAFSIASILVKSDDPTHTIFAAAGQGSTSNGGFYVSIDGGQSWTRRSTQPVFTAGPGGGGQTTRQVGNLLAYHPASGKIFAATDSGLMRSSDGGFTWVTLGAATEKLRGLAVDPNNAETIYVASTGNNVWKATSAVSCDPLNPPFCSVTKLGNSPPNPEELVALADGATTYVYVAAGGDGVYRSSNGGTNWFERNTGLPVTHPSGPPLWISLAGTGNGNTATLYVGAQNPVQDGGAGSSYDAIFKSTNGGSSWTSLTDSGVSGLICGASRTWWEYSATNDFMLGESQYTANQIALDPSNSQRIVVAGRSGLWSSSNGGTNWCPLVNGLMVAQARDIVQDPNMPSRFYTGSADFTFFYSTDSLATVTRQAILPGSGANIADIALDTSSNPSTVFVSNGDDGQTNWDIYRNSNPVTQSWVDMNVGAGGGVPSGIATRQVGGSTAVLVGVANSGIWRYTGSWTQVKSGIMTGPNTRASTAWLTAAGSWVYLYDSSTGLWQSDNNGALNSWSSVTSTPGHLGYLAADPSLGNRIYLSVEGVGVFRIDNADTHTPTLNQVGSLVFTNPGPIAVKTDGTVYVTEFLAEGSPSRLWSAPSPGTSWTQIGDAYYEGSGYTPVNLTIGTTNGKVYVAVAAGGVIIGTP
jgi:hypothetical protein